MLVIWSTPTVRIAGFKLTQSAFAHLKDSNRSLNAVYCHFNFSASLVLCLMTVW